MVRRPHNILIKWNGIPTKNEETGKMTPGAEVQKQVDCSVAQNTRGRKIGGIDGSMIDYGCTALMDKQPWNAPFGAEVVLTYNDGTFFKTTVKRMHNFQTHSQIWL